MNIEDNNVQAHMDGQTLVLRIDLDRVLYETGKSEMIATSHGWAPLDDNPTYALSLNVIRKKGGKSWRQRGDVR